MTPEEAMARILEAYHKQVKQKPQRRISFSVNDWPSVMTSVRVNRANMPIIGEPNFAVHHMTVLGFTEVGEILQFLELKEVQELIYDPFGPGPVSNGVWVRVRLLDGQEGWLLSIPGYPKRKDYFAEVFERNPPSSRPRSQQDQGVSAGAVFFWII